MFEALETDGPHAGRSPVPPVIARGSTARA